MTEAVVAHCLGGAYAMNMASIADSSAVREPRVLSQHQAALTLLQGRLNQPGPKEVRWLDLACGRGQIISYMADHFNEAARASISFHGFDINQAYERETAATAAKLGFKRQSLDVGRLSHFDRIIDAHLRFDFITMTNTVHELSPSSLSGLLLSAVRRLASNGTLFIYDMEQIDPPELGAIPWRSEEFGAIVLEMLDGLSSPDYRPQVSRWPHSRVTGWNVQIDRQHILLDDAALSAAAEAAANLIDAQIRALVAAKLRDCKAALRNLTENGTETAAEERFKLASLYELWALTRASELGQ